MSDWWLVNIAEDAMLHPNISMSILILVFVDDPMSQQQHNKQVAYMPIIVYWWLTPLWAFVFQNVIQYKMQ